MRFLTLLCPALALPRDWGAAVALEGAPGLNTLLVRSRRIAAQAHSPYETLCRLFDAVPAQGTDPPIGALARLGDGGRPPEGWWLRADPVCLVADRDRLFMLAGSDLKISQEEASHWVARINETLGDGTWLLEAPRANRWYLNVSADPGIRTRTLTEAAIGDLRTAMPEGRGAAAWHAWLTEVQMLLHDDPINRKREARDLPPVNSVWLWGSGRLPTTSSHPFSTLWGDDPVLAGLAELGSVPHHPCPDGALGWLERAPEGESLVMLSDVRMILRRLDPDAAAAELTQWDRAWFGPLLRALRLGRLARLRLYGEASAAFELTQAGAWRFWRRP